MKLRAFSVSVLILILVGIAVSCRPALVEAQARRRPAPRPAPSAAVLAQDQPGPVAPLPPTYWPESIDSLWESTKVHVQVKGTVAYVHVADNALNRIELKLGDKHGHFLACILATDVGQPIVGTEVIVFGTRKQYSVADRGQGALEINPVVQITYTEEK